MFNQLEREVQGKAKKGAPYEKVLAHFLTKRGVKRALVPANFPLGFANEIKLKRNRTGNEQRAFWLARGEENEAEEIRLLERALRMTETGMKRANGNLEGVEAGRGEEIDAGRAKR